MQEDSLERCQTALFAPKSGRLAEVGTTAFTPMLFSPTTTAPAKVHPVATSVRSSSWFETGNEEVDDELKTRGTVDGRCQCVDRFERHKSMYR